MHTHINKGVLHVNFGNYPHGGGVQLALPQFEAEDMALLLDDYTRKAGRFARADFADFSHAIGSQHFHIKGCHSVLMLENGVLQIAISRAEAEQTVTALQQLLAE